MLKKLLLSILLLMPIKLSAVDIIVWAETSSSITLDRYTIQRIFTRKVTKWPDGTNITVFIKPVISMEHKEFVYKILKISPFYYQQLLEQQTFSGKASSVVEVQSDSQMHRKITSIEGSIGYVNYEIYKDNKKVIIIDDVNLSKHDSE